MSGSKGILTMKKSPTTTETNLNQYTERVNRQLEDRLPKKSTPPVTLHQAMRYAVLGDGKRIRPALLYATGEALGTEPEKLDASACAVELMHSYSLIHDDLPAMDDDDLRRGQPTCHKAFDEAMAILAGDAIQALAFAILASDTAADDRQQVEVIRLLAESSGSAGIAGGQAIDLASTDKRLSKDEIEYMHGLKTGALFKASVLMAAIISRVDDADVLERLTRFSDCIGLAFQIRDDILDINADKLQGKDTVKPTYPDVVGLERAKSTADELLQRALDEIRIFDLRAEPLREVCSYMVLRNV